jgi:hypothetical protein
MLMLGMRMFKHGCMRLTGESMRISLPGECVDALFQRFTVVVNNMRANVDILPYDGHDRVVKLLHALDHTVWDGKVEAILESEKYTTLTVNELFSKLKSAEVDRGLTAVLRAD